MNKDTFDIIIATTGTILAVISLIFGIYKSRNTSLAYKRVMEVYEPIFNCLEKYLFKYNPTKEFNDAIEKCANIIMNNRAMFGYGLYDSFNEFYTNHKKKDSKQKSYVSNNFNSFSSRFLRQYHRICKDAGLPHIELSYRLNHYIYKYKAPVLLQYAIINFAQSALVSFGLGLSLAIIINYYLMWNIICILGLKRIVASYTLNHW